MIRIKNPQYLASTSGRCRRANGEEIYSEDFFMTKLKYMHLNPVWAGIVLKEEEYLNSS